MITLTLYGRPGCGLCDQARAELERLKAVGVSFELAERNIDDDPDLLYRYLERIPIVEFDGEILSELRLDPDDLRSKLATVLT